MIHAYDSPYDSRLRKNDFIKKRRQIRNEYQSQLFPENFLYIVAPEQGMSVYLTNELSKIIIDDRMCSTYIMSPI